MKKKFIILNILLLMFSGSYAQEIITQLSTNPQLTGKLRVKKQFKSSTVSLQLPFVEDFSNYTGDPDSNLWLDNLGYVNTQFAIFPPTIGVVTLDALNQNGVVYPHATTSQFPADTLTSHPIRLDSVFQPVLKALKISDSLYFSFFFQPSGGRGLPYLLLGDAPEAADSLVLEFYSPVLMTWNHVWSTKGMKLDSIYLKSNRYFKYVILAVNDSANYYKDGFQFRFRNYCSLGNSTSPSFLSNCDQWNIDYVYLGINRTINDTVLRDLAFVEKAPSFLTKYQAIPAKQFQVSDVKASLNMLLSNIDGIAHSSNYKYEVWDQNNVLLHTEDRGFENISSFWTNGYQSSPVHANPPVTYNFSSAVGNKSWFEIRHIFKEGVSQDIRPENDTNRFIQNFGDYYAYDDGSAENGYGLYEAGAMLAYKFVLNVPDTLVAVEMFFNTTFNNANQRNFYLTVWNNNGSGKPGSIIYQSNVLLPVFESGLNQFHSYILDNQVHVNGTIFVGWVQATADNLNIGFDRNTSSQDNIFYNTLGTWEQSFVKGSLMIRPVFGTTYLGVDEAEKKDGSFDIFPNPLIEGNVNFTLQTSGLINEKDYIIMIYNMLGKQVYHSEFKSSVDVSQLPNAVYLITLNNTKTKQQQVKKFIIAR